MGQATRGRALVVSLFFAAIFALCSGVWAFFVALVFAAIFALCSGVWTFFAAFVFAAVFVYHPTAFAVVGVHLRLLRLQPSAHVLVPASLPVILCALPVAVKLLFAALAHQHRPALPALCARTGLHSPG